MIGYAFPPRADLHSASTGGGTKKRNLRTFQDDRFSRFDDYLFLNSLEISIIRAIDEDAAGGFLNPI